MKKITKLFDHEIIINQKKIEMLESDILHYMNNMNEAKISKQNCLANIKEVREAANTLNINLNTEQG